MKISDVFPDFAEYFGDPRNPQPIEKFINNPKNVFPFYAKSDLQNLGFSFFGGVYEFNFYFDSNVNPEAKMKNLMEKYPEWEFVFILGRSGEFYVNYSIMAREKPFNRKKE